MGATAAGATIPDAPGTAAAIADGQSWIVADTAVALDAAASGANLTWSYTATGLPEGVGINTTTGAITGTPLSAASGTATVTAIDQYGRPVQDSFTWTAELRAQAVAAGGLGPFSFTVDDEALSIDFAPDFTTNGNTLSYTVTGLPDGCVDDGDGTASGVATTGGQSGPMTCTATDEYGRETISTASYVASFRAPALAANALPDRDWIVDDDTVSLDLTGDFSANGNTLGYAISGLPTGLSDDGDGSISGTPTVQSQSGPITIVATDEYGRQTASAFSYTTALRAQAVSGAPLDLAFAENEAIPATDLLLGWVANGNTLSLASVLPALPAGLAVDAAGILSGTPLVASADATYTVTMADEYGRQTQGTLTLEVTPLGGQPDTTAPTATSLSAGVQDSDGDVPVAIDGLDEDSTAYWVLVAGGETAPTVTQILGGQNGLGGAPADSGNFLAAVAGGPYNETLTGGLDGAFDLHVVFRDTAGNTSDVYSDTGLTIDTTGPVLERIDVTVTGATTTTWQAYTDEDGGAIYVRVRPATDPAWTAAQIIANPDSTDSPAEAGPAPNPDVALFLIAGQSNARGQAIGTAPDPASNTVQWDQSGQEAAVPSGGTGTLDHIDANTGYFGIDRTFSTAFRAADPTTKLVFIPCAEGNTGFTTGEWLTGEALYDAAVTRANAAIAHYGVPTLSGILWHQGEDENTRLASFQTNIETLIADMRADITGATDVPFVVGEILSSALASSGVNPVLNALPSRVFHVECVEMSELSDNGDGLHFDAAALTQAGTDYHTAWVEAQVADPPGFGGAVPVIAGVPSVGETLTATPVTAGPLPVSYLYQWQRDGVNIPGATGLSYTLVSVDAGADVRFVQTATNAAGATQAASVPLAVTASFNPASLFAGSEIGIWFDPSDLSSLAQNSDGTGAVAVGDPVGYMTDKSGNGFHAVQTVPANRPILRQSGALYYLDFDGAGANLEVPMDNGGDFNTSWTIAMGHRIPSGTNWYYNDGTNAIIGAAGNGGNYATWVGNWTNSTTAIGTTVVQTVISDFDTDATSIRIDGVQEASGGTQNRAYSTGQHRFVQGGTGALDFYGQVIIERVLSAGELTNLETYLADKSGVTI